MSKAVPIDLLGTQWNHQQRAIAHDISTTFAQNTLLGFNPTANNSEGDIFFVDKTAICFATVNCDTTTNSVELVRYKFIPVSKLESIKLVATDFSVTMTVSDKYAKTIELDAELIGEDMARRYCKNTVDSIMRSLT